jgi:hypothetical protein
MKKVSFQILDDAGIPHEEADLFTIWADDTPLVGDMFWLNDDGSTEIEVLESETLTDEKDCQSDETKYFYNFCCNYLPHYDGKKAIFIGFQFVVKSRKLVRIDGNSWYIIYIQYIIPDGVFDEINADKVKNVGRNK